MRFKDKLIKGIGEIARAFENRLETPDAIELEKEKCWIGLQEERGAVIRVCTCHAAGGVEGVGTYLANQYRSIDPQKDMAAIRQIIDMGAVVSSRVLFGKIVKAEGFPGNDMAPKEFGTFDAFRAAFFGDDSIDYAYLYAVDEDDPVNYLWVSMTKVPFELETACTTFVPRREFLRKRNVGIASLSRTIRHHFFAPLSSARSRILKT